MQGEGVGGACRPAVQVPARGRGMANGEEPQLDAFADIDDRTLNIDRF